MTDGIAEQPRRIRNAAKLQVDLPNTLMQAVRSAAKGSGKRQALWVRNALTSALTAELENQAAGKLNQLFDRIDGMASRLVKLDVRVGELYAQARAIENDQRAREGQQTSQLGDLLVRIGEGMAALDRRTENVETILSMQRLLIGALAIGGSEASRKALTKIMEDPSKLSQLIVDWRKG